MGSDSRSELLRRTPDIPRWVEARAMLRDPRCVVSGGTAGDGGFLVVDERIELVVAVGLPEPELVTAAVSSAGPGWCLLAMPKSVRHVTGLLPRWSAEMAVIHRLSAAGVRSTGVAGEARIVSEAGPGSLDHLPRSLQRDLGRVGSTGWNRRNAGPPNRPEPRRQRAIP